MHPGQCLPRRNSWSQQVCIGSKGKPNLTNPEWNNTLRRGQRLQKELFLPRKINILFREEVLQSIFIDGVFWIVRSFSKIKLEEYVWMKIKVHCHGNIKWNWLCLITGIVLFLLVAWPTSVLYKIKSTGES